MKQKLDGLLPNWARSLGWWSVSRYKALYRDRNEGLTGWGWVTIQSIVS